MERVRLRTLAVTAVSVTAVIFVIPAIGSADGASRTAAASCKPKAGAVTRTLRLKLYSGRTVRANVGDTIGVIARMKGYRVDVPTPLANKHAVCRISWHRMSASEAIATFRIRRAQKVTFGSSAVRKQRTHPRWHSRHPVPLIGYTEITA